MREQRRFERVHVRRSLAELFSALDAQVTWPNEEVSDVLDLSYKGLAVKRPGMFPVNAQTHVEIALELGRSRAFRVPARVAWCTLDNVGLALEEIPAEGHQMLHEFLDAKLTGARLKPVERVFFGSDQTFTFWYQAPGVHLFIWLDAQGLVERVSVQFGEESVQFERGQVLHSLSPLQKRAILVLSQMDKPDHPMEEFVRTLKP
jgi:hypothetical protein